MRPPRGSALLVAILHAGCSVTYRITPVDSPPAAVRYDHGRPTISLTQRNGGVQITPLGMNSGGRLEFAVAAYNGSYGPGNLGVENLAASSLGKRVHIYTIDELIREERNAAIAASVALALIGAAAAAASQAAAHQSYRSTFSTPHGTYVYRASYYNAAQAAAGTAASIGAASAGIYAVNRTLDETIANMGQSMLQTTTVDPGYSVGGRIIVQQPRGKFPKEISLAVDWMGEHYPFQFQISKGDGKSAAPPPRTIADASTPALEGSSNPLVDSTDSNVPSTTPARSTARSDPQPAADARQAVFVEQAPVKKTVSARRARVSSGQNAPTTTLPENYLYEPSYLEQP